MIKWLLTNSKGILFSAAVAFFAVIAGHFAPVIGASVFGIVMGILIGNFTDFPAAFYPGLDYSSKKILKIAIVLVGAGLSFSQVLVTGADTFFLMAFTIAAAFLAAFGFGRIMGISSSLKSLIGVGTAICGGSAIAAIAPIIDAEDKDISYSISTVFLFNIAAVFVFPPLGHLLGFTDHGFGLWAGTAINDTSSVVAAGYTFSSTAGDLATIVKLTRTTMIVPIALVFAAIVSVRSKKMTSSGERFSFVKIFPWFVLGFCAMSMLNSLNIVPVQIMAMLKNTGRFMIVMALAAIGLKTNFRQMISSGWRPLVFGCGVWFVVAVTGLAVQYFSGQW